MFASSQKYKLKCWHPISLTNQLINWSSLRIPKTDEITAMVLGKPRVLDTLQSSNNFQLGHDSFPMKTEVKKGTKKGIRKECAMWLVIKIVIPKGSNLVLANPCCSGRLYPTSCWKGLVLALQVFSLEILRFSGLPTCSSWFGYILLVLYGYQNPGS